MEANQFSWDALFVCLFSHFFLSWKLCFFSCIQLRINEFFCASKSPRDINMLYFNKCVVYVLFPYIFCAFDYNQFFTLPMGERVFSFFSFIKKNKFIFIVIWLILLCIFISHLITLIGVVIQVWNLRNHQHQSIIANNIFLKLQLNHRWLKAKLKFPQFTQNFHR